MLANTPVHAGVGRNKRRGVTLVELLVVIAIIGILVSLVMPAVQAARETARKTECINHLKQIATGLSSHVERFGHMPSSGWGWKWPPIPGRGDGELQPGSWVFCILPTIEQIPLWESGITNDLRLATPLELFNCPSRRAASLYPCVNTALYDPYVPLVAKSDYAANAGDHDNPNAPGPTSPFVQPMTIAEGDDPNWWVAQGAVRNATGIIFQRSNIQLASIQDGTSNTYMVGEKMLDPNHYMTGGGLGDMESIYHGANDDTSRVCWPGYGGPHQDTPGLSNRNIFGGPHVGGFNMAFVDGSVHRISYGIDVEVHRRLSNRRDGLTAQIPEGE